MQDRVALACLFIFDEGNLYFIMSALPFVCVVVIFLFGAIFMRQEPNIADTARLVAGAIADATRSTMVEILVDLVMLAALGDMVSKAVGHP
jgi:branched-subunit amino acid transport protein